MTTLATEPLTPNRSAPVRAKIEPRTGDLWEGVVTALSLRPVPLTPAHLDSCRYTPVDIARRPTRVYRQGQEGGGSSIDVT
jgi:hypothetical protein